jgi:prephenate dehydrogenase
MPEDGFKLANCRVTIVGLGLMGASLAMDLHGHCAEIIGVSRSLDTLTYALDHQIVDRIAEFGPSMESELVILAAPVRTIIRQLRMLQEPSFQRQSDRPTVLIDLGSTKTRILQAMEDLPDIFDPVGGHPMCGKEVSGIRQAELGLYRKKTFVLTPLERTSSNAMDLIQEMIRAIGAVPLILAPEKQDELVALTSHLPYLLATALMKTALDRDESQIWQVAASGFRDTSRLAASDLDMMIDILLTNRPAILAGVRDFHKSLDELAAFINNSDEEALRSVLTRTQQKRTQLFNQEK